MRARYESTLFDLRQQLAAIINAESQFFDNFGGAMNLMLNLPELYQKRDINIQRDIISSITPGKIYFENGKVRTSEINQAITLIATIDKGFAQGNTLHAVQYEPHVRGSDPNPTLVRTLPEDLRILSELFKRVA